MNTFLRGGVITVVLASALALGGCAPDPAAMAANTADIPTMQGPVIKPVASPYAPALACISKIPITPTLLVGVGKIVDKTNKFSTASDAAAGGYVSQGAGDMMVSSLAKLGVQVVDLSSYYQHQVDWYANKGAPMGAGVKMPQFMVQGSISALDLNYISDVKQLQLFGIGPRGRAYRSSVRMDLRLTTMPFTPSINGRLDPRRATVGGVVAATSSINKQVIGVEDGLVGGNLIGHGNGLTFMAVNFGQNQHEQLQAIVGNMDDYAAGDLVLGLLRRQRLDANQVNSCQKLLDNPYGTSAKKDQSASAG